MKPNIYFIIILILIFFFSCQNDKSKKDNNETIQKTQQNSENTESTSVNYDCVHCGMPSQEFPEWHGKFTHVKGQTWTCSPRCMFLTRLKKEQKFKNLKSIEVIDYYSQKPINAQKAFYVTGSDVIGPMGADLVPFSEKEAAKEFKKEHQGKEILAFKEVSLEKIEKIINQ